MCLRQEKASFPSCAPTVLTDAAPPGPVLSCRVRNFLRQEMASFLGLCEYTDRADAARARSYFFDRRKEVGCYAVWFGAVWLAGASGGSSPPPACPRTPPLTHHPPPTQQVLLYTERAQFYNRHRVRGARTILFYQLPEHPQFYAELLNLLEEGEAAGEPPTSASAAGCMGMRVVCLPACAWLVMPWVHFVCSAPPSAPLPHPTPSKVKLLPTSTWQ